MNTNTRSTFSTATALGLVSFITTSALVSSVAAPATIAGLGFLAVYGVVEIALISYAGPRWVRRSSIRSIEIRQIAREADILAFPSVGRPVFARAA